MRRRSFPSLLLSGVALFAFAAAADLGHHVAPSPLAHSLESVLGPDAVNAHLLLVLAMALVLLGGVQHGMRRHTEVQTAHLVGQPLVQRTAPSRGRSPQSSVQRSLDDAHR